MQVHTNLSTVHRTERKQQIGVLVALLKRTMPFQVMPDHILQQIAEVARPAAYHHDELIYAAGDMADDIYIVASGQIKHAFSPATKARDIVKLMHEDEVFGWAALLKNQPHRLATTTCVEDAMVVRIEAAKLLKILETDPESGDVVMSRFATMITRDFTVPEWLADIRGVERHGGGTHEIKGTALTMFRLKQWIRSPRPYLMLLGFVLILAFWYLSVEVLKLPRFDKMPGLTQVFKEWISKNPTYGLSLWTPDYYYNIWVSTRRVAIGFFLSTLIGVPLGLFFGWSKTFKEYVFPVFEVLRPIPPMAWVPLAIVMFTGSETPVIFLTFLAAFYATSLNTMLGVESIDESYVRAAYCLGAKRWQVFRHIIVPGALPYIFTGLQISVGVAWFSLVAAEMISGQYGLGYVINTSYTMVRYPTIIIGMITLGIVGYVTSALVRVVGDYMMQWRVRELALGGQQ